MGPVFMIEKTPTNSSGRLSTEDLLILVNRVVDVYRQELNTIKEDVNILSSIITDKETEINLLTEQVKELKNYKGHINLTDHHIIEETLSINDKKGVLYYDTIKNELKFIDLNGVVKILPTYIIK